MLRFPPQSKTLRAHASNRLSRERFGVRRQSAAATAHSRALDANELPTIVVRSKAAWRFASRRSPRRFAHTRATAFRASVLECAGRAQRRRRFRAHQTPTNYQQLSSARKRRGASLPAAVQDASRTRGQPPFAPASWSAPAERSDDGAFARTRRQRTTNNCRPLESGVALRFPPQSKTLRAHAGNRLSRQRLGVRPALWRFSSGPSVSLMRERLARASGGERAALQALREVRRRLAVAPVFGVR